VSHHSQATGKESGSMKTIYGTLLQPRSAADCAVSARSVVQIGDDGRISTVESGTPSARTDAGDASCWILPGFIDAHLHLPQWDRRGIDGYSLFEWYEQVIYPAELRMRDADFAERLAEDFVSGCLANGTTAVAAFGSPFPAATERVFRVFERRGFRAIFGMILNDASVPSGLMQSGDEALEESRSLAGKWHGAAGGRLNYAFSPRTPASCSEKLLRGTAAIAGMLGCYVQTHVAESTAQVAAVRESFPDRLDDVDVFAETGLLRPRTLLGHGVFLNQQQRQQVARAGTAVIHCPTANLFLESGVMDYHAHQSAGIRMALGSSIAGGHEVFMPQVAVEFLQTAKGVKMHSMHRGAYRVPSPSEAWWMLTRGAAEALNLGERIGTIAPGYDADFLVVRPEKWIADLPVEQQVSALLYTLRPHQIEHVFIAGKRVGP
jgi:guanine deaminase